MAEIYVHDEFDPESIAMMQALYSRSPKSVTTHVEKVRDVGPGKFMSQYYVGYGHKSIGDCGTTTLFFENVSLLAAKAIQDWPLYNGQEASTRYLDFSEQLLIDPVGDRDAFMILERWMAFYNVNQHAVRPHVRRLYPRKPDEDEVAYEKAVKARVFDIMRAFLPAGVTTFVSWHTNLRQAQDHLNILSFHPLLEVRQLAHQAVEKLKQKYPNSFSEPRIESKTYHEKVGLEYSYHPNHAATAQTEPDGFTFEAPCTRGLLVRNYEELIAQRPPKTELPHFLSGIGNGTFCYYLDFGSYRDAQRHRNGVNKMPMLSPDFGFHPWYLEQLPDDVRVRAESLIAENTLAMSRLECRQVDRQYYCALGYLVPCVVSRGLPGLVYEAELRSSKTVHPTYRRVAQRMAKAMKDWCPEMALHADMSPDDWDVRRGTHDIVERKG